MPVDFRLKKKFLFRFVKQHVPAKKSLAIRRSLTCCSRQNYSIRNNLFPAEHIETDHSNPISFNFRQRVVLPIPNSFAAADLFHLFLSNTLIK